MLLFIGSVGESTIHFHDVAIKVLISILIYKYIVVFIDKDGMHFGIKSRLRWPMAYVTFINRFLSNTFFKFIFVSLPKPTVWYLLTS